MISDQMIALKLIRCVIYGRRKTGWLEPHPDVVTWTSATRVNANPLYSARWFLANENFKQEQFSL